MTLKKDIHIGHMRKYKEHLLMYRKSWYLFVYYYYYYIIYSYTKSWRQWYNKLQWL